MTDTPVARSPIVQAGPVEVLRGWEVSRRRTSAPLTLADLTQMTKIGVKAQEPPFDVGYGKSVRIGDWLVTGSGPGEWTLLGPVGETMAVTTTGFATVIDLTHGRALMRLTGKKAARVMEKVCSIDLSNPMCPDGAVSAPPSPTSSLMSFVTTSTESLRICSTVRGPPANSSSMRCWTPEPNSESTSRDFNPVQPAPARTVGRALLPLHVNAVSFVQMRDLAVRGSSLEYWFFRLNTGPLASLVDFIIRRRFGAAEVRVSLWVDGLGRVERVHSTAWRTEGETVDTAGCTFGPQRTTGRVEDVEWDLSLELGSSRIDPAVPPVRLLHPFDMEIASRPRARFSGQVTVGDRTFPCVECSRVG